jgi:hypothetical protein
MEWGLRIWPPGVSNPRGCGYAGRVGSLRHSPYIMGVLEDFDVKLKPVLEKEVQGLTLSAEEQTILAQEWYNCSKSLLRFLGYCKLSEPPVPGVVGSGGIVPFALWPHIMEMVQALSSSRLIVILKSRQIGASWLMAAYDLWFAKFHQSANVFLYSKGETEAWEKLDKCRRIEKQLPRFLQMTIKPDSSGEMHFPSMSSTIRAFPATQTAGISFTASILDFDEWEEHPYAEQNYAMAKPTIDAGGQFIGTFTVNKMKPDTLAKTIFKNAWDNPDSSNFKALFFPYWVRPGRSEEWYNRIMADLPAQELQGLTPELYMEQGYPRSVEEALRPTQTTAAFSQSALTSMMADTRSPLLTTYATIDPTIAHIYQDFNLGQYFIAATDISHGVGKDYNCTCIMNVQTGAIQADILDNTLGPEEMAFHSIRLLEHFKNPLWYIEANDYGGIAISTAVRMGYPNLGYQDEKREKPGFLTQAHRSASGLRGSRIDLWGQLLPAINNRQIVIYNKQGLGQFFDIIRNVAKEGRIEASAHRHDDYPMTAGICWLMKDQVQTGMYNANTAPIQSLTFSGTQNNQKALDRWMKR